MNIHHYCVIMCGGIGSRFWPISRNNRPKQFLDFLGTGKSLLQLTVERISHLVPSENIILVTNRQYENIIREQLPEVKPSNILLEPARRNTAPCVCWAAQHIHALDPEAAIVTLPSDHLIMKEMAFIEAVEKGLSFVSDANRLLTLGIKPTNPNTGYGYIQQSHDESDVKGIMKVKSFTEKPDLEMAKLFLSSGEFFWNAGIFLWKASSILESFRNLSPEIYQLLDAPEGVYGSDKETAFIDENFPLCPNISIDYAIMEKADNVYVETVDLGWSDLGTWGALYDTAPHDENDNVTRGRNILAQNCTGSMFAVPAGKVVVAAGLKDFIVADSDNALLICPRSDEQIIRHIVTEVKSRFGEEFV